MNTHSYSYTYCIAQKYDGRKYDEFDEWRAIRQNFPFQSSFVKAFLMKPAINSSNSSYHNKQTAT